MREPAAANVTGYWPAAAANVTGHWPAAAANISGHCPPLGKEKGFPHPSEKKPARKKSISPFRTYRPSEGLIIKEPAMQIRITGLFVSNPK